MELNVTLKILLVFIKTVNSEVERIIKRTCLTEMAEVIAGYSAERWQDLRFLSWCHIHMLPLSLFSQCTFLRPYEKLGTRVWPI